MITTQLTLFHSILFFTSEFSGLDASLRTYSLHMFSILNPCSIAIAVLLHLSTQNIGHKCFCYNWLLLTVIIILIHSRLGDQGESGDLFLCLFSCEEFDSFPPLLQCMAHPLSFLCEQF